MSASGGNPRLPPGLRLSRRPGSSLGDLFEGDVRPGDGGGDGSGDFIEEVTRICEPIIVLTRVSSCCLFAGSVIQAGENIVVRVSLEGPVSQVVKPFA
jgi:hypothetical protein